jgi:hypothetical protein
MDSDSNVTKNSIVYLAEIVMQHPDLVELKINIERWK